MIARSAVPLAWATWPAPIAEDHGALVSTFPAAPRGSDFRHERDLFPAGEDMSS